jgi:hypothetical protein
LRLLLYTYRTRQARRKCHFAGKIRRNSGPGAQW